jgi:archaellum component FlaC
LVDRATELLLTRILESIQRIEERIEKIEADIVEINDYEDHSYEKLAEIKNSISSIVFMEDFMREIEVIRMTLQDRHEKLEDNINRVNHMTLEAKGVIAQARSVVSERKEFVKKLGEAFQELT